MNKEELLNWLANCEKKFEIVSDNLEEFSYAKGLITGAKIAISSVIDKLKKEDN